MKNTLIENFTGSGTVFSFRFWAGSRCTIGRLVFFLLLAGFLPSAAQSAPPALPQVSLNTPYTSPSENGISVTEGDGLYSAINTAQPRDISSLAAGATLAGNSTLPNKSAAGWIVIRTSAPDISLPSPGTRITPDPVGPKVLMLRHFRDYYLLTHSPGQAFVKWYYRVSPPLAEAIRNSFMLRIAAQITLWPLVALVWCVVNPETGVFIGFLVVVACAAGREVPLRKSNTPFISSRQDIVEEKSTFSPQSRHAIPFCPLPSSLRALPHSHDAFRGGIPSKKYVSPQRPGAHKGGRRRKKAFARGA